METLISLSSTLPNVGHSLWSEALEGARTPFEMSNELANFFSGSDSKRSILDKHQGRIQWVRKNLDEILAYLQVVRKGKWSVGSLIVIDRELFTPFLRFSPVPIIPLERIREIAPDRLSEFLRDESALARADG